ncbi:MAG TPA: RDD family protein [Thermoanaerobaculia bacterium]|jgi:uncharacterized RDD family membrane protein YckC
MTTESTLVLPPRIAPLPRRARPPFWLRVAACLIDGLLLSAIVRVLSLIAQALGRSLGTWDHFAAGVLGIVYLGFAGSERFHGRSIGKRICGIAVVRRDGTYLPLGAAMLRALVLMLPVIADVPALSGSRGGAVLRAVIFGLGCLAVYLFLANRATRQTLHDLAVGSLVLQRDEIPEAATTPRLWRGHLAIGALLVAPIVAGLLLLPRVIPPVDEAAMRAVGEEAHAKTGLDVRVQEARIRLTDRSTRRTVVVSATLSTPVKNQEALANMLAAIVARHYDLRDVDGVDIVFVSARGLLVVHANSVERYSFTHDELLAMARSRQ